MLTLTVYRGDTLVQNVAMDGRPLSIGRLPENDLVLPDDGRLVSKVHAELRMERGAYFIRDRSTNGTWLDGQRITRAALTIGRDVVIGPYRLVLSDDGIKGPPLPIDQTDGPKNPIGLDPMAWLGRYPQPLMFGGAVMVLLLVGGIAVWQLSQTQTQEATSLPDQAAPLPEPEAPPPAADPHAMRIAEATSIIKAAERALDEGSFAGAVAEFESAKTLHLDPVLQADSNHGAALDLQRRADEGIARAQTAELQAQAQREQSSKAPTPDENFKRLQANYPLPKRPDESIEEWSTRNERAISDNQAGLAQLKDGNCLEAKKTFSELSKREPSLADAPRRLQEAIEQCNARGQAAITRGRQKEDSGDWVGAEAEYTTAKRFEHPDADRMLANNLNQRKKLAAEAIKNAKQYANRGLYSEAIKQYNQVTSLLQPGDTDHQFALAQLAELKRRQ